MEEEKTYEEPETMDGNAPIDEGLLYIGGNSEEITDEKVAEPFKAEEASAEDSASGFEITGDEINSGELPEEPMADQDEVIKAGTSENTADCPSEDAIDSPREETTTDSEEEKATGEDDYLSQIDSKFGDIADSEQRIFTELREIHKLYHTEFAGRLKSMQDELDQYRKIDKGRAYDDILAAIARIYGTNETLEDEVSEPKAKKSIRYMLLDLEELLESYGMNKLRSTQGEKRNPRHCQILNRIPTDDPTQHDTVAKSYNSGFYIGNRTVIKELVDIYFYEERADQADERDNAIEENVEISDSE